jgi:paraquat-inducible protein A
MQKKITISLMLLISITFFVLGLTYPILSTKQQVLGIVLKYNEVRLFDSIKMFYESNDYLLALIIFLFTIVLPIVKFIELTNRIHTFTNIPKKINDFLHLIDKWSMLDVFLVALLLLNFKMDSNIIVMKLKIGTSFIAFSIIIRMITTELTSRMIKIEMIKKQLF